MKKIVLSSIIAAAGLAFASHAAAADYDISLGVNGITQDQLGDVNQAALAVSAAVGEAGDYVNIDASAITAVNLNTLTSEVTQSVDGVVNGDGQLAVVDQSIEGALTQASTSLAGSGDLGTGSIIGSSALALGNLNSMTFTVNQ